MTQAVEQLLLAFDAMSDAEKHIAAVEVLRRAWPKGIPELSDESLVATADELFLELDAREAADARR
ncbi:MAG: hypothetical protein WD738_23840 [Pirellulales bacterium]